MDPDDGATRDDWTDGSIDGNGAGGVPLVGHDPYDERRFRLSRPRVAGACGAPAAAMAVDAARCTRRRLSPLSLAGCGFLRSIPLQVTRSVAGPGAAWARAWCRRTPTQLLQREVATMWATTACRVSAECGAALQAARERAAHSDALDTLSIPKTPLAAVPADTYTPAAPLETVRSGRLEPPNVPPDEARQRRLVR